MNRINGMQITGSYFGNNLDNPEAKSPEEYGVGITAVGSGFDVLPLGACSPLPCNPTRRSVFEGLGIGVDALRSRENRPFKVINSWFKECFFGISNFGVSGPDILFNTFEMGNVPSIDETDITIGVDQIGISMSDLIAGMQVQENRFVRSAQADITGHLIGIVMTQIGTMDQAVRKNYFYRMDVANESIGRNGQLIFPDYATGLRYFCNQNNDNIDKDFWIQPADQTFPMSGINREQGQPTTMSYIAAGNSFSATGDMTDGDFGNYGDWNLRYLYYPNGSEVPQDFVGMQIIDVDINNCTQEVAFQPYLTEEDYNEAYAGYFAGVDSLNASIIAGDSIGAAYYKFKTDSLLHHFFRYFEYDTTGFSRDSIRKWYLISGLLEAHLLLAGSYHEAELFTKADSILDSILVWHTLEADQILDIERIRYLFGLIESDTIPELTQAQYDSLLLYSQGIGASYSLAASILALYDTIITPRYYIPGELTPRSKEYSDDDVVFDHIIRVYPNPASNEIFFAGISGYIETGFALYDLSGRLVVSTIVPRGSSSISIDKLGIKSGLYIAVLSHGNVGVSQKLVILR